MKMISSIFMITLLLQPPASFAVSATSVDECTANGQAGMRACLEKKSQESAIDLALAEKDVMATLARWDEDPKYLASARSAFKQSSKSFITFRQDRCAFAASLGGGAIGNALALRQLACLTDVNRVQAASLRAAVATLPER